MTAQTKIEIWKKRIERLKSEGVDGLADLTDEEIDDASVAAAEVWEIFCELGGLTDFSKALHDHVWGGDGAQ